MKYMKLLFFVLVSNNTNIKAALLFFKYIFNSAGRKTLRTIYVGFKFITFSILSLTTNKLLNLVILKNVVPTIEFLTI